MKSTGNPYIGVYHKNSQATNQEAKDGLYLFKITTNDYLMQSQNWHVPTENETEADGDGIKFDMKHGKLTAYGFDLKAYSKNNQYAGSFVRISSDGNPYIQVHYQDSESGGAALQGIDLLKISNT